VTGRKMVIKRNPVTARRGSVGRAPSRRHVLDLLPFLPTPSAPTVPYTHTQKHTETTIAYTLRKGSSSETHRKRERGRKREREKEGEGERERERKRERERERERVRKEAAEHWLSLTCVSRLEHTD
jgi:hypothetical protein